MDRGDGYYFFTVPFDPHDIKYYTQSLTFKNLYGQLKNKRLPEGVRLDKKHERVIMYTKDGGESRRVMQLLYFQTNKEYRCDNYAAH